MFSITFKRPEIYFLGNILSLNSLNLTLYRPKQVNKNRLFYNSNAQILLYNLPTSVLNYKNNNIFTKILPNYNACLIRRDFCLFGDKRNINNDPKREFKNEEKPLVHYINERTYQEEILSTEILKNKPLTIDQWDNLKSLALKSGSVINNNNIDGFIMNTCIRCNSFYTGKSYFKYIDSTSKKFNLALIGNYMKLCYFSRELCTVEDLNTIEMLYNKYILKYPILDANSAENVILGISLTKHWSDYKTFFDMIWISCSPGVRPYSAIVEAAFLNKDYKLGWQILKEMRMHVKTPLDHVWEVWLNIVKEEKNTLYLEDMLNYYTDCDIKPSMDIANRIRKVFENLYESKAKGMLTSVTSRGYCKSCKKTLEPANISDEEFNKLKTAFLDPVLIGKDIFLKTRPEELLEFQKFLEKTAPYDVVLDGLNIAYSAGMKNKNPKNFSFMVKSVVAHFVNQSKKVLVLGRMHMKSWPRNNMKFIEDNACMFLAEDISQDDPFLLYAALYSGPKTDFVSRDLMRGHKFLLKQPQLKSIFMAWQTQHQVFLTHIENNGVVYLKPPVPYCQSVQRSKNGSWHIPIHEDDGNSAVPPDQYKLKTNFLQQRWLCLRQSSC